MSTIGQIEKKTQERVVKLFRNTLKYDYLGDWTDREDNRNIEEEYLIAFLREKKYSETLISRALHELNKIAGDQTKSLYDINRAVYEQLRYGVKVKPDAGENTQTVWLIDWEHPYLNHFAIAEEVTITGKNDKRPDIVIYVNGIALGVLELKRSTVSVSEGIRQNLDSQKPDFIERFFATIQLLMAGNDTEGLRYGVIETPEKYYLTWKEASTIENLLDKPLTQLCEKSRFLEIIHDFMVFDAGVKKTCRHHQYFGVKAAQASIRNREGGIIWHTQGSGKSLIMVWLAKWLRENVNDARVLIITDRDELDEQIEKVFLGVDEKIHRTTSGTDLLSQLNFSVPWLLCSLVHKFGRIEEGEEVGDIPSYIQELIKAKPKDFTPKGNLVVFIDECHRTQSGELHEAMRNILPDALFIGFTGTPLLKSDKRRSIEVFGKYIHTYKYDEAVKDKVVLDLRYEARDIDQNITSQERIDQWFTAKTKGLNDIALAQLKRKWGTMQKVLSSLSRLNKIVADILLDMETKDRLLGGRGNAMLVSGSIYQACKLYELFTSHGFNKCAIVTSYQPSTASIKGEETGEGTTERLQEYAIYKKMLADWFREDEDTAVTRIDEFEKAVKKKFIKEPGQMKLLIVVDKLLTGFDAPPATYLYIDKEMRDHGLFQAICRVNRLDGEDKEYGYIIDYRNLFKSLEGAVADYTSGAFDGYDKDDVLGLLTDRLNKAKERLGESREAIKYLCEPVDLPKDTQAFMHYFCAKNTEDKEELKENEPRRLALYRLTSSLIRAFADVANEMEKVGYTPEEIEKIKQEVYFFEKACAEVRLSSGDFIDMKMYEPAMRHLIDTYIQAEESKKISAFDDMSLIQLIVERGADAVKKLPESFLSDKKTLSETIENNIRRTIIDEQPINPKYYEKMSELLDALIQERKKEALDYKEYLNRIVDLTKKIHNPAVGTDYPPSLNTPTKRALYDNLGNNEALAIAIDEEIRRVKKDSWRGNRVKEKEVQLAIQKHIEDKKLKATIFELVKKQHEY